MIQIIRKTINLNEEREHCVYEHKNKINNKIYVGQTIHQDDLNRRWCNGYGYKYNKHFYNAIQKYGWDNFEHIVVIRNLTKEEADLVEIALIDVYNTLNKYFGYNIANGGNGGVVEHSEEIKQKISNSLKGRTPWNKGKTLSEEHKEKCSASLKGKNIWTKGINLSEEHKEKISNANKGKNTWTKGRKAINNGKVNKYVKEEEINVYLNKGWKLGRHK